LISLFIDEAKKSYLVYKEEKHLIFKFELPENFKGKS